jgi:predicted CXXCH cytochrome family protein
MRRLDPSDVSGGRRHSPRSAASRFLASAIVALCLAGAGAGACTSAAESDVQPQSNEGDTARTQQPLTTTSTPIGLAIEIDNGVGVPLDVRAGQTFYINQIDIRATIMAAVDEGVAGLDASGDFAAVSWNNVQFQEQEFQILPGPTGQFTRSRFYNGASWMTQPSFFFVFQVDENGVQTDPPIVVNAGSDAHRHSADDFFVRRFRAIQWTRDCPSSTDCSGATQFEEEALIELRNATDQLPTFQLEPTTTALRVYWSMKPSAPYVIPLTQVASPPYDYGFAMDLEAMTPPGCGGYYLPGQDVTFRVTLRDGSGNRLHPEGSLPSYNDVVFGPNEAGFQYYRGFFDNAWVFWRRKHRERTFLAHIMGPAQNVQPIRSIIPLASIITQDLQTAGELSRDGVFAQWKVFPTTDGVFGGAFDPTHAGWAEPGSDTWDFNLPDDAEPGTYRVTAKARRTYLGEDIAVTQTIEIQVGSATPTTTTLTTGPCSSCHSGGGSLANVLHANPNRATCAGCHAPLAVEYDAPIYIRTHFLHSRSNRFDANVSQCSLCHLTPAGTERTSKSACLSCHKSYPPDHVTAYGPIVSIYTGGGTESFDQCTSTCHVTHPDSGF